MTKQVPSSVTVFVPLTSRFPICDVSDHQSGSGEKLLLFFFIFQTQVLTCTSLKCITSNR
jgi:hypothetical protein